MNSLKSLNAPSGRNFKNNSKYMNLQNSGFVPVELFFSSTTLKNSYKKTLPLMNELNYEANNINFDESADRDELNQKITSFYERARHKILEVESFLPSNEIPQIKPLKISAKTRTYYDALFYDLIKDVDRVLFKIEYLFMMSEIHATQMLELKTKVSDEVNELAKNIQNISKSYFNKIKRQIREDISEGINVEELPEDLRRLFFFPSSIIEEEVIEKRKPSEVARQ